MPKPIVVYTTQVCPYCVRAKALLKRKGLVFTEIDVSNDQEKRDWLSLKTGRKTVPQIFIGDTAIGGSDELHALERSGDLDRMLRD